MINAEALIGTTVGNCLLEKLIGQGTRGGVFLGQQARPARQVAVKVIAPPASQLPDQQPLFLERFHQEIAAVAALKHQNILPIYEHGEHNGLAYLVMPYIGSGTLQHVLASEDPLPFAKAADYLSQMAAALDFAHSREVVHREVRPANVLRTPDGRLLLTDFGLAKIAVERQTSLMPLLQAGTPVGALEYMAPEQVMGDVVDAHTDLYALGVILYQMVTANLPFQGGTPMQIATQLVQEVPPSPRSWRSDLSLAAEQVILRAIAKHPADRYDSVQDFANEFRIALTTGSSISISSAVPVADTAKGMADVGNPATPPVSAPVLVGTQRSRGLFAPTWQKVQDASQPAEDDRLLPVMETAEPSAGNTPPPLVHPRPGLRTNLIRSLATTDGETASAAVTTSEESATTDNGQLPFAFNFDTPVITPAQTTLSASSANSPTHMLVTAEQLSFSENTPPVAPPQMGQAQPPVFPAPPLTSANVTRTLEVPDSEQSSTDAASPAELTAPNPLSPFPASPVTGTLMVPVSEQGNSSTIKLTSSVKVVQVPVAGQPGCYVTGFLPVMPQTQQPQQSQEPAEVVDGMHKKLLKQWQKIVAVVMVVLLVLSVSGMVALGAHVKQGQKASSSRKVATPDVQATAHARATATVEANIILSDPLNQNIHNWPVSASGNKVYAFKDGAYHIFNNDPQQSVPALLGGVDIKEPMVYTLTMEEIKGNDSSINNSFGMIVGFSPPQMVQGKSHTTFYTFQVVNTKNGEYQFSKYDDIKGPTVNPYNLIWHHAFGREFHQGQGASAVNTFKIVASGKFFAFFVNGQKVGSTEDSSLSQGEVGMIVNLKGTEVAFSNLLLTYR